MKRSEKLMAGAVGCLVPISLFVIGLISYTNEYDNRKSRIANIEKDIEKEQKKSLDALNANLRRNFYYRRKSMPSDDARASLKYRDWLFDLVDASGLNISTISSPSKTPIRFNDGAISIVANRYRYSVTTAGTLDEIIKFCYEFDKLDLLHNIASLSITPAKGSRVKGVLNVVFKIDVLSLLDADEDRDFLQAFQARDTDIAEYESTILARNLFGEPNTAPTLSISRKSYETGEKISFTLSGRDIDKDDLTYELVDAGGIEGIEIESKDKSRATFKCPPQKVGEYTVVVAVKDSGYPQKSSQDDFKLVIKDPPPKTEVAVEVTPEKPKFVHATKSEIKMISSRRVGNDKPEFSVVIDAMTLGQKFNLKLTDSFELDDKTWVVKNIDVHTLTLEVDGKELEFRQGDFLSEPQKETLLQTIEPAEVSTVTD